MGARTRGFANNVLTSGKLDATDGLTGNLASTNFANATVTNIEELPPAVGSAISSVAGNPAAPVAEGKIWYNTNTDSFNIAATLAAWSSAAPTINARSGASHGGTQDAAIISGGADLTSTEEYNGSGWSAGGALNTGRTNAGGAGIQTATLVFGGTIGSPNTYQTVNESYDGTSWTEEADISTARYNLGNGCGTQTSALYSGGYNGSNLDNTEEWNGTSWTAGTTYPTIIRDFPLVGTQDAALGFGGFTPPAPGSKTPGLANSYDGSTWTSITAMNTGRAALTGGGIQTYAIGAAGYNTPTTSATANTEIWDGTSWTESADLATPRFNIAGSKSGTASAFLGCTGYTPGSQTSLTEEYNVSLNVITAAAWSSGANYPVTIQDAAGAGPVTANATWGGYDGPAYTAATNEYNGSAWTSSGNMNTARSVYHTGIGSQTAALGASGYIPGGGPTGSTNTESYDGSTWTNVNSLSTSRYNASATGIQTSAILTGGNTPSQTDATEEWDGTSWTAGGSTPVVSAGKSMSGQSNTDAILIGANNPPASTYITLSYNGTSWSDTGHNLLDRKDTVAGGSQQGTTSAAIIAGGFDSTPAIVSSSYQYNGSSWVTGPSISTARRGGAASGTYQSALAIGGEQPAQSNATEEFTGETSALNVESLTTS